MLQTLKIRHYRPVCDVSETGLLKFGSWCSLEAYVLSKISEKIFAKSRLSRKKRWSAADSFKIPQQGDEITQKRPKTIFQKSTKSPILSNKVEFSSFSVRGKSRDN